MQVTSLLSSHEHKHDHDHDHHHHDHDHDDCTSCGHDHEHTPIRRNQIIAGLIFIVNAFVVDWALDHASMVSHFSAMIGAIILGYPIIWTSIKDIRKGTLTIKELRHQLRRCRRDGRE